MEINKNEYLRCVLKSYGMNLEDEFMSNKSLLDYYREKRDKVEKALKDKFGSDLIRVQHSGSYAKHTAINIKFDMDLCLHFKNEAFKTLEEMYQAVFTFLNEEFQDDNIQEVADQAVSVGLYFIVDGEKLGFDVTPGRRANNEQEDINLYISNTNSNWQKTNITKQIDHIHGRTEERKTIRLLKAWKFNFSPDIKSFLIELLVIRAFNNQGNNLPNGLWERLKMVIEFITQNIEDIVLDDPGNPSNNVAKSLTKIKRSQFSKDMDRALKQIDANSNNIKLLFPPNPKFPCDEEKASENKYTVKSSNSFPTILPPTSYA